MENITKIDVARLNCKYAGEIIEEQYEKAYSTILFSDNYVFKVFSQEDDLYDYLAIENEYEWDCTMPYLSPVLHRIESPAGQPLDVLVMKRLPKQSNILFGLVNYKMEITTIVEVGYKILEFEREYKKHNRVAMEIYHNYIINVKTQIKFLDNKISNTLRKKILSMIDNPIVESVFLNPGENNPVSVVHGNLFSGNIFYYDGQVIIIDPISIHHMGRISYPDMDIASFLVDLKILLSPNDFCYCWNSIVGMLSKNRIQIIEYYMLLKLLVRLRFAFIEQNSNNLMYENNMNLRIIDIGEDVLQEYVEYLDGISKN